MPLPFTYAVATNLYVNPHPSYPKGDPDETLLRSRNLRPCCWIALEWANADYEVQKVDYADPAYKKINPLGMVPALDIGGSRAMTQANAILQYIADSHPAAKLGAAGASGVPGGSLMLIPMACSLLGIDGQTSAQVIAIGVLIGVIQDSAETALNSSSDVIFTAAADLADRRKNGATPTA